MIKVTSTCEQDYLRVYFNEVMHLSLYIGDLVGVQSYVESSQWWCIEYTFKKGAMIRSQYDNEETWSEVLKQIGEYV